MEVNETIIEVKLDMEEDQLATLSDEGRQAQWPWGEFFQRGWVESDIRLCQARVRNNKKQQHVKRARVSVVLVSSHPETHVFRARACTLCFGRRWRTFSAFAGGTRP